MRLADADVGATMATMRPANTMSPKPIFIGLISMHSLQILYLLAQFFDLILHRNDDLLCIGIVCL